MSQSIYINMPEELAGEIESRAAALNLSASTYIQLVLLDCLECGDHNSTSQQQ